MGAPFKGESEVERVAAESADLWPGFKKRVWAGPGCVKEKRAASDVARWGSQELFCEPECTVMGRAVWIGFGNTVAAIGELAAPAIFAVLNNAAHRIGELAAFDPVHHDMADSAQTGGACVLGFVINRIGKAVAIGCVKSGRRRNRARNRAKCFLWSLTFGHKIRAAADR